MWSIYSYNQTNTFLLEQAQINFRDIYTNIVNNLDNKFRKVEHAFSLITKDSSVGQIINNQYLSNYQKYYDITYKIDPMINTLKMLNPEIVDVNIYTTGDIKSTRVSFIDLDVITQKEEFLPILNSVEAIWFFSEAKLYIAQQVLVQHCLNICELNC